MQLLVAAAAFAQEPATRAEVLAREREAKSKELAPPEPGRVERALLKLENDRILERLLEPPEGFYPKISNITAGSGIAVGPGYRRPRLLGGHADFSTFAVASFKRYWMLDARLTLPELGRRVVFRRCPWPPVRISQ